MSDEQQQQPQQQQSQQPQQPQDQQQPQQQQSQQPQQPQDQQQPQPQDQQLPPIPQVAPAVAAGATQLPTPPPPPSRPVEAEAAAKSTGGEASATDASLRARFISRLIGFTELLNSELPAGSCMSHHRLRHYLAGSTQPSELADCLLQFEDHLGSSIRERGPATTHWRDQVLAAQSLDRLGELLNRLLTINRTLARLLRGRRGVCCSCRQPVTASAADGELAFCHSCCCNYHHQCAEPAHTLTAAAHNSEAPTSVVADVVTAAPSKSAGTLWLCAECRRPQKTPDDHRLASKKRKVSASNQKLEQQQPQNQQQPQDQQQPKDQQQQPQDQQQQQPQDQQQLPPDQKQQQPQDQQQQQSSRDLEQLQPQEDKQQPQVLQQARAPTPPSLSTVPATQTRERGERPTTRFGFGPPSLFSVSTCFGSGLRSSPATGYSNASNFGLFTPQRRPAARVGSRDPVIASYPNFSFPIIAQASQNNAAAIPRANEVDYDMADEANAPEQARAEEEEPKQDPMEE